MLLVDSPVSDILISWYSQYRRDLPWRNTTDPYVIWISEIILQQTRVKQGLDYFNRFMERFPTVALLAAAHEDEVLKYWQGLGYYSRARNIHAAAKDIMTRFGGRFPVDYTDVLSLKGVGEYTAAAICSFAYRAPCAVVDGNVYRVLSRLFAIDTPIDSGAGKKMFAELAGELIDPLKPDLYNQAIMDFGAMQCVPRSPQCEMCPLAHKCLAYAQNRVGDLPVKHGKTVIKSRFFNYLQIVCGEFTWLDQRLGNDIWKGLFEFPLIETDREMTFEELQQTEAYGRIMHGATHVEMRGRSGNYRHVLSHRIIYARFYTLHIPAELPGLAVFRKIKTSDQDGFAVSRLTQAYINGE